MIRILLPYFFFIVHAGVLFHACEHNERKKNFPLEYRLTSVRVPLYHSGHMEYKNGFLILFSNSIHIYSTDDYSLVSSFGGKQQLDAFQSPQFLRSSTSYLYIMDVDNKNEIRKYQIDSLGQATLLQACFAGVTNSINRPYILHDTLLVYDEFVPEASIKIHNLHTNTEILALHYGTTSLDDRFFDKNMGGLYVNDSCIAFAYKYQDKIDFYDWKLKLKHSVNHQKCEPKILPEITIGGYPESTFYYGSSYMGRNYFYTLYRGVTQREFRSDSMLVNKEFNTFIYGPRRDVLEVYDLNGQPVCRYYFDDISPSVFVVDEKQNRLFGYRTFFDSLLVYQLQGLSKNRNNYSESEISFSSLPPSKEPDNPKEAIYFERLVYQSDVFPMYLIRNIFRNDRFYPFAEASGGYIAPLNLK